MSIVVYRRLIRAARGAAVLLAAIGATGFAQHRGAMQMAFMPPSFALPIVDETRCPPPLPAIWMPLGAFQADDGGGGALPQPPKQPGVADELRKLGRIRSAIVVYPPYDLVQPTIVFEFKEPQDGVRSRTIRLGEALIEVKQEGMGELKRPFRFKFVGIERDPKRPDAPLFVFDVDCDGKNLQKLRWVGDDVEDVPAPAEADEDGPDEPKVQLFVHTDDVNEPTAEGRAFIEKRWESLPADVRTQPHVDPKTGKHEGVRILGIKPGSVVHQFRLVADDVVVAINGRPVSHKAETIRVIREELRKGTTRLVVRLRRAGRVLEETFDTRDPATREAAKAKATERR